MFKTIYTVETVMLALKLKHIDSKQGKKWKERHEKLLTDVMAFVGANFGAAVVLVTIAADVL